MTLREKIALGNRAKSALDSYLASLVDEARQELLAEFEAIDMGSTDSEDRVMQIKDMLSLWKSILDRVQSDINTGKIAEQQLETSKEG